MVCRNSCGADWLRWRAARHGYGRIQPGRRPQRDRHLLAEQRPGVAAGRRLGRGAPGRCSGAAAGWTNGRLEHWRGLQRPSARWGAAAGHSRMVQRHAAAAAERVHSRLSGKELPAHTLRAGNSQPGQATSQEESAGLPQLGLLIGGLPPLPHSACSSTTPRCRRPSPPTPTWCLAPPSRSVSVAASKQTARPRKLQLQSSSSSSAAAGCLPLLQRRLSAARTHWLWRLGSSQHGGGEQTSRPGTCPCLGGAAPLAARAAAGMPRSQEATGLSRA